VDTLRRVKPVEKRTEKKRKGVRDQIQEGKEEEVKKGTSFIQQKSEGFQKEKNIRQRLEGTKAELIWFIRFFNEQASKAELSEI
jgi:hypothetical protein